MGFKTKLNLVELLYFNAAKELKLPYLSAYLDSLGTNFSLLGMVQILQQEVHQFVQVVIVHSILAFKHPSSYNSNLVQLLYIINSAPTVVSLSSPLSLTGSFVLKMLGNTTFCGY